jgi:predicted O-methyltransferase YrrM
VLQRSYHALGEKKREQWLWVRRFVPHRVRWFFEGCIEVPGQLWRVERRLLYEAIRARRPAAVFEVGTWYGGGSTYFISQALYENRKGVLHTVEVDAKLHAAAVGNYDGWLAHLKPYVQFHLGRALEVYPALLKDVGRVDVLFLDGAQDAGETLAEFGMFLPYLKRDAVLAAHDWDNDKMALVRPIIEHGGEWRITRRATAPQSVGFVVCEKLR